MPLVPPPCLYSPELPPPDPLPSPPHPPGLLEVSHYERIDYATGHRVAVPIVLEAKDIVPAVCFIIFELLLNPNYVLFESMPAVITKESEISN